MDALAPNEAGQQPLRAGCCAPDALTVAAPERLNVKPCYLGAEVEVGTKAGPIHPSGANRTGRSNPSHSASPSLTNILLWLARAHRRPMTTGLAHKPPDCGAPVET